MTKYTPLLALLLIGCTPKTQHYTVTYKDLECKSFTDVGIKWDGDKYVCTGKDAKASKSIFASFRKIKKVKVKDSVCQTTITKIYTKQKLSVCMGKILGDGEKTRIIKINK